MLYTNIEYCVFRLFLYLADLQKVMDLQVQSFLRTFQAKKRRTQDIVVRLFINL